MELVEQPWLLDWQELLSAQQRTSGGAGERELAELVVAAEVGTYSWTCTDWAMTLVECSECAAELGTGPVDCVRCALAEELRWSWDHHGHPGAITALEHSLRVARAVLRAPHRTRDTVVKTWRLCLPFLLAGDVATAGEIQRIRAQVLAGHYDELARPTTQVEVTTMPELFWRRGGSGSVRVEYEPNSERQQDAARRLLQARAHARSAEPPADAVREPDEDQAPDRVDGDPDDGDQHDGDQHDGDQHEEGLSRASGWHELR